MKIDVNELKFNKLYHLDRLFWSSDFILIQKFAQNNISLVFLQGAATFLSQALPVNGATAKGQVQSRTKVKGPFGYTDLWWILTPKCLLNIWGGGYRKGLFLCDQNQLNLLSCYWVRLDTFGTQAKIQNTLLLLELETSEPRLNALVPKFIQLTEKLHFSMIPLEYLFLNLLYLVSTKMYFYWMLNTKAAGVNPTKQNVMLKNT
jgi:hypothetical protein